MPGPLIHTLHSGVDILLTDLAALNPKIRKCPVLCRCRHLTSGHQARWTSIFQCILVQCKEGAWHTNMKQLGLFNIKVLNSAARKFEKKIAKFLKTPKDLHQSNFKITKDLHQRPPKSQKYLHQSTKNYVKNWFKQVFLIFLKSSPKKSQILKSPNQKTDRQMVQKVTQMAINCQIWQHCF